MHESDVRLTCCCWIRLPTYNPVSLWVSSGTVFKRAHSMYLPLFHIHSIIMLWLLNYCVCTLEFDVYEGFLTRIGNIHFFANVLEGIFGEYHSSSVALGNVLSSQSKLSRVLAGLFSLSGRCL